MSLTWVYIVIAVVATAVLTAIGVGLYVRHRDKQKVAFILDALEDGELNFRFQETSDFNRTLNRIRSLFAEQRQAGAQESYQKLIRVLTHEIMNTISPISSLSEALAQSLEQSASVPSTTYNLQRGLQTIADSSRNLINFVQSYRQLSGIAKPMRQDISLDRLITRVLALTKEQTIKSGVTCTWHTTIEPINLYADEGQITQVFINLILNAIQAGATTIDISARVVNHDVIVNVENNGKQIPESIKEQIFVPFYTTKQQGSGVGLSISQQIMLMNNGSISLESSTAERTLFVLTFH